MSNIVPYQQPQTATMASNQQFCLGQQNPTTNATASALARLAGVLGANKEANSSLSTFFKNAAKVQPLFVDGMEPAASLVSKPILNQTLQALAASQETRFLILALVTAVVASVFFGHKLSENYWLLPLILVSVTLIPIMIEKSILSIPVKSQIQYLDTTQRGLLNLARGFENFDFVIKMAAIALMGIVALQKYQNPSDGINTSFSQTAMICTAVFMLMPQLSAKLLKDVEAGLVRPVRDLLRCSYATSEILSSKDDEQTIGSSLKRILTEERKHIFAELPSDIKDQYIRVIEFEKTLLTQIKPAFITNIGEAQTWLDKAEKAYKDEQEKPLFSYNTSFLARFGVGSEEESTLQRKKQDAVYLKELARNGCLRRLRDLKTQFAKEETYCEEAKKQLDDLITSSQNPTKYRELIQILLSSRKWHHAFIQRCQSLSTTQSVVQTAGKTMHFTAKVAQILTQDRPGTFGRVMADSIIQASEKLAGDQEKLKLTARHIVVSTAINGITTLLAPQVSKCFLNLIVPFLIQKIGSSFSPEVSFFATQVAALYGYITFMSLVSGLQEVYSPSNIAQSNAIPLRTFAGNVVEFLATRPQTISELLEDVPTQKEQAREAFNHLLRIVEDKDFSIFTSHRALLEDLKYLGISTRILPDKKIRLIEGLQGPIGFSIDSLAAIIKRLNPSVQNPQHTSLLLEDATPEQGAVSSQPAPTASMQTVSMQTASGSGYTHLFKALARYSDVKSGSFQNDPNSSHYSDLERIHS